MSPSAPRDQSSQPEGNRTGASFVEPTVHPHHVGAGELRSPPGTRWLVWRMARKSRTVSCPSAPLPSIGRVQLDRRIASAGAGDYPGVIEGRPASAGGRGQRIGQSPHVRERVGCEGPSRVRGSTSWCISSASNSNARRIMDDAMTSSSRPSANPGASTEPGDRRFCSKYNRVRA
jgi:hypothetical protein